jgi:hypothetical protein
VFALMDQRVQPFALLVAELHDALLYGSSLRSPDASPSLRSHRFREPTLNQRRGVLAAEWENRQVAVDLSAEGPDG